MSDEWLHEKNTDEALEESPSCKIVIQAESAENESALQADINLSDKEPDYSRKIDNRKNPFKKQLVLRNSEVNLVYSTDI